MTSRDLHHWVGEYANVLARAGRDGWLAPLLLAHLTPCGTFSAEGLLDDLNLAALPRRFHPRVFRGRAHHKRGRYWISLPEVPGSRSCHLRLGLVLHEAAHIFDHRKRKRFGHGEEFCRELRTLLTTTDWRRFMPTSSYRAIYARHRGPFSLLITREAQRKGKTVQESDRVRGPLSAEEAHEEARILVNSTKDNVVQAFVFSDTEGQFIGAFYERGMSYKRWSEEQEVSDDGRLEFPDERVPAALLHEREEPVQPVADPEHERVPRATVPRRRPVRDVPAKVAAEPRTKRRLGLNAEQLDRWPKSEAAQVVRAALIDLGEAGITAADLAERITPDCAKLGVAFPASLISRLKQGGFLKEITS